MKIAPVGFLKMDCKSKVEERLKGVSFQAIDEENLEMGMKSQYSMYINSIYYL